MSNGIKSFRVEEGNLMATKDLSDFGGPNQWNLWVKTKDGYWEDIQWMGVNKIQQFFTTKLPVYKEYLSKNKPQYQLA